MPELTGLLTAGRCRLIGLIRWGVLVACLAAPVLGSAALPPLHTTVPLGSFRRVGLTPVNLPRVQISGYYPQAPANTPLARAFNGAVRQYVVGIVRRFRVIDRDTYAHETSGPYSLSLAGTVTAIGKVISGYLRVEEYTGGAHPGWFYYGVTYAMIHGRVTRCSLGTFTRAGRRATRQTARGISAAFQRSGTAGPELPNAVDASEAEAFVITQKGAMFLFDDYALKGFNVGDVSPVVPFRNLPLRRGVPLP